MTHPTPEEIARGLSVAQRCLLMQSGPDDIDGREGVGVDIRGQQYRTARTLRSLGLGDFTHGSFIADMYWNNTSGLAVRDHLKGGTI